MKAFSGYNKQCVFYYSHRSIMYGIKLKQKKKVLIKVILITIKTWHSAHGQSAIFAR